MALGGEERCASCQEPPSASSIRTHIRASGDPLLFCQLLSCCLYSFKVPLHLCLGSNPLVPLHLSPYPHQLFFGLYFFFCSISSWVFILQIGRQIIGGVPSLLGFSCEARWVCFYKGHHEVIVQLQESLHTLGHCLTSMLLESISL